MVGKTAMNLKRSVPHRDKFTAELRLSSGYEE
jgi:hypothetical protein